MSENVLGRINKQLSEENCKLQNQNEKLEIENKELRLLLAKNGDGKIIPLDKSDDVKVIAYLKTKVKNLENRLSKYENVAVTDRYDEVRSYTDIIDSKTVKTSKINTDNKTNTDTDCYKPQDPKSSNNALIKKKSSNGRKQRISSEVSFEIVKDFLNRNGKSSRLDISSGTDLSEHQVERAVKKFGHKLVIEKDPINKRRILYSLQ